MIIWVVKIFFVLFFFCIVLFCIVLYSCHLFLISFASVRSIPFLSFIEPIFAWNVPLVCLIFLMRSLSLSFSIVFLYFFALITEEGFLISPRYSLELCIQMGISFLFSFCFSRLFFSQLFVKPPQIAILPFLHFFFLGMVLLPVSCTMSRTSVHSSSGILSHLVPWNYLSLPLCNR